MSEAKESTRREKDPADALAALAAGEGHDAPAQPAEPQDPSAVLDRMIEGETEPAAEADPPPGEVAQEAPEGDSVVTLEEQVDEDAPAPAGALPAAAPIAPPADYAVRRAHAVRTNLRQARAHAHLYRRTMIPLLIVVGVLLIVVGGMSGWMLLAAAAGEGTGALTLVLIVSFPLAGVLFFGAWWFRRDTRSGAR